jgi:Flp pilus assembly protein TadD
VLCGARVHAGQPQQAVADCNEALRLSPSDAATLASRGFAYLKLGQFDRAITDYDAALQQDPKHAVALYGRGIAKLKKADTGGGNVDIAAATALKPDIVQETELEFGQIR